MPKIENAGRYPATVQSAEFGESEKGTPFLNLSLNTDDGAYIGAWLYLSEKALANSVKTLRDAFGFDGNFETVIDQITGKPCSITVEFEADDKGQDRLRVKWINAPRTTKPIENQNEFLKSLTSKASRIPAKAAVSAAPTRAVASSARPAARPTATVKAGEPEPF